MAFTRIPASVMFAVEATRASIAEHHLPVIGDASGPWYDMDVTSMAKVERPLSAARKVYVKFSVHGIERRLESICHVERGDNSPWNSGLIQIMPLDRSGDERFESMFQVHLVNHKIVSNVMLSEVLS